MRHSPRILLVEDYDDARHALAKLLRLLGMNVFDYPSAEAALGDIAYYHFDYAILDFRLPGIFGDELARLIHRQDPTTQIVFLTAESNLQAIAQSVPGCIVLQKPAGINQLEQILHAA